MTDKEPIVPVLFRADSEPGDNITAVFPTLPGSPGLMSCYAHIGQHSSCSRDWLRTTRPAKPEEYASLKRELESAPYRYQLKVCSRISRAMDDERRAEERR